jgi:hypothetical protein
VEHKFQWSIFTDATKTQQYVVRCDEIDEFTEAMELVQELIAQRSEEGTPVTSGYRSPVVPSSEEGREGFCPIHNQPMKLRSGKNGNSWYDHRWQENDIWHHCNGKRTTSNSAHS